MNYEFEYSLNANGIPEFEGDGGGSFLPLTPPTNTNAVW